MKIVGRSNYDKETVSDVLIAENVGEFYGERIVSFLNGKYSGDNDPYFFFLMPDDYKLYMYEP